MTVEEEHWRLAVSRISSLLTWDLILCLQKENVTLNGWEEKEKEGAISFPLEFFGNSQEDRIKKIHNSLLSVVSTFLSLLFSLSGQIRKWSLSRLFLLSSVTSHDTSNKKEWEENEESLLCLHVRYNITTKAGLSFLRGSKKTQRRRAVRKKNNTGKEIEMRHPTWLSFCFFSWKFWRREEKGSAWRRMTFSLTGLLPPFTLISCLLCHTKEKSPLESTFLSCLPPSLLCLHPRRRHWRQGIRLQTHCISRLHCLSSREKCQWSLFVVLDSFQLKWIMESLFTDDDEDIKKVLEDTLFFISQEEKLPLQEEEEERMRRSLLRSHLA